MLVPTVYRFFALNLLVFWLMMRLGDARLEQWTAWGFFVWMGVFGLFSVSILWSFLADVFSSRQGERLFGLISGGGTLGALCGSLVASQSVRWLGVANLLLIPVVLLELSLVCVRHLGRSAGEFDTAVRGAGGPAATGGGILAGFTSVLRSRYLFGISAYLFLATFSGTIIYCQQAEIVRAAIADDIGRTRLFANVNLAVQIITFTLQTFVTARLIRGLGLPATLCLLPLLRWPVSPGLASRRCSWSWWWSKSPGGQPSMPLPNRPVLSSSRWSPAKRSTRPRVLSIRSFSAVATPLRASCLLACAAWDSDWQPSPG